MGHRLMQRAVLHAWPRLESDRARIVLVAMALHAMDSDETPAYFGGWEALSIPLGYSEPNETARRAVQRAVTELRDCGLITQNTQLNRTWKRRWMLSIPDR